MDPERKTVKKEEDLSNADKIKLSAMRLFSIYGYGSTTVRMIAQEAGLSPGQIAAHFGSKEELYESIVKDMLKISNEAIRPVREKRAERMQNGAYTRECIWELIEQLVCELVEYCFIPRNRTCLMMMNVELPNSLIVGTARRSFQDTILKEHEMLLATLLNDYTKKKGYLKCRVISRAVNGSIVSFSEHAELLMEELYANKDPETALNYAKGHLKNFLLNSMKQIDEIEDITKVEKYKF